MEEEDLVTRIEVSGEVFPDLISVIAVPLPEPECFKLLGIVLLIIVPYLRYLVLVEVLVGALLGSTQLKKENCLLDFCLSFSRTRPKISL